MQIPVLLLSAEHFLREHARVTPLLTPSLHKRAVIDKGSDTTTALYPQNPDRNPIQSNVIGLMLVMEGFLLL